MREIKFKLWDKVRKEWVSPNTNIVLKQDGKPYEVYSCFDGELEYEDVSKLFDVVVSTGLKDKNGKEIYEGYILRIGNDLVEEVEWVEVGNWMGEKQPMVGFISHGTIYKNSPIEIIGNIYENKDLIE